MDAKGGIMGWLKKVLLGGVKTALKGCVAKLDDLQPKIRALIEQHGPDAADKIVDMFQDWINAAIDRSLP